MKSIRPLLTWGLRIISLFALVVSAFFGWLFYQLYLKWFFLFENGRYFDPQEEVVYEDSSILLGLFSLLPLLVSVVLWIVAAKLKSAPGK
jgi:hypothetical protein